MVFALPKSKSAICVCVCVCPFHLEPTSHLPPPFFPLGCHRAMTLVALLHASDSHWLSIFYTVMDIFQCYSLKSPHPLLFPLKIS